jgi:hypothetical protein
MCITQESPEDGLSGSKHVYLINKNICLCDGNTSSFICKRHKQDASLQDKFPAPAAGDAGTNQRPGNVRKSRIF